tara:strand:- start:240 stop:446 length:207 start_codon:yes stop_codon:yes gene_type:complete
VQTNYKIPHSEQEIIEMAQAREIYITYCFTKDRVLVNKQVQYSAKWHGKEGSRRIMEYVKRMDSKELE